MPHQTSFSKQVARDLNSAGVGTGRTWLTAPIRRRVMSAEKFGAFFVIKLNDWHERMAVSQNIVSNFNAKWLPDIDNCGGDSIVCTNAHFPQPSHLITRSIRLTVPFPDRTRFQTGAEVMFDDLARFAVKTNHPVFK